MKAVLPRKRSGDVKSFAVGEKGEWLTLRKRRSDPRELHYARARHDHRWREVQSVVDRVPADWTDLKHQAIMAADALEKMENSTLVREALGEHIFEWFLRNKRSEWRGYKTHVSAFERDRYLITL